MSTRWRFLQTGDLHIGRGRARWGEKEALNRSALLFDVIYKTAKAEKCHAVLITGDVFDTKAVTNGERELVARKFAQYAGSTGIPTYVIPGNHDLTTAKTGNLDYLAEISGSGEMPNLHVAHSEKVEVWDAAPGLSVIGAPVGFSENQAWVDEYAQSLPKDRYFIFMGHATVAGCVRNDMGWKPPEQEDSRRLSLAAAAKAAPQVVFWAYGDIHKRQKLPTLPAGSNGWYAGSPIQMDFGEEPDRGALVVVMESKAGAWSYVGKRYVRFDTPENGFAALIKVTSADQVDSLPKNAYLLIDKDVVLSTEQHKQVVGTFKVVEDRSTPELQVPQGQAAMEVVDPLLADLALVEKEVLAGLASTAPHTEAEAKKVVGMAIERFRERTYVS
jgi:DNA repair exonuclease SbcCD nuclease subunit